MDLKKAAVEESPVADGFKDLTSESVRQYFFKSGAELTIEEPVGLKVQVSGRHRVYARDGRSYIINPDWDFITFKTRPGSKPFSF